MSGIFDDDDDWANWFQDTEVDKELDIDEWKYVLGLDPGGTTGLALFRYTDDILPELIFSYHIEGGLLGYYDFFFESYLDDNLTVVSEKWVERNVRGSDHTPTYIEGCQLAQWGIDRVVYQTPDQKQMVPDEKLKEQNLWVPNARHAMDATIHVLIYLRSIKHRPTLEALSGLRFETIGETDDSKDKFGGGGGGQGEGGFDAALRAALAELAEKGEGEEQGEAPGAGDAGDDEHGTGSVHGDYNNTKDTSGAALEKDDGIARAKRMRNGVFIGFAPTGDEEELYSD